ncbi:hypothetical protein SDC9_42721 [bioreactor metagenome]|uniref:Uncharacterized protein n=1 Tax=bioreactor metagenome TaxID=1076179 RepID=A0A644VYP0_9ZZZZ|nr:DUF6709 family protein [Dehalococcoides mccartyi]
MWDSFVGNQIRRCNRNLLVTIILIALVFIAMASFSYTDPAVTWIILGSGIVILLYPIICYLRQINSFSNHPVMKTLRKYDGLPELLHAIDEEVKSASSIKPSGKLILTPNWAICLTMYGIKIVNLTELVWVYPKKTTHTVNFILPLYSSNSLCICAAPIESRNSNGNMKNLIYPTQIEIDITKEQCNEYMQSLQSYAPWVLYGYADDIESCWKKQPLALLQAVLNRKEELSKTE